MVERKLPKLETGVRFPSPAPSARRRVLTSVRDSSRPRTPSTTGPVGQSDARTVLAGGGRLADLATEVDQPDVHRRLELLGHELLEQPLGAFGRRSSAPGRAASPPGARACRPGSSRGRTRTPSRPPPSWARRRGATRGTPRLGVRTPRAPTGRSGPRAADLAQDRLDPGAFVLLSPPERIVSASSAVGARPRRPTWGTARGAARTRARRSGRSCAATAP